MYLSTMDLNLVEGTEIYGIGSETDHNILMTLEKSFFLKGDDKKYYYHVTFPGLEFTCDLKKSNTIETAISDICKFKIFSEGQLDTGKAELYCVLRGKVDENEASIQARKDSIRRDRSIVAVRDTLADFEIGEEKIFQGGVEIGSWEADTLKGLQGIEIQFRIYNPIGAMICNATVYATKNLEWRILTLRDNRFHSLSDKQKSGLKFLLNHLTLKEYL